MDRQSPHQGAQRNMEVGTQVKAEFLSPPDSWARTGYAGSETGIIRVLRSNRRSILP
jgi:hypothetical protein